ncbi:MAG: zinc ribbon domain-containing protein [Candidatus Glassbacteria bacterium]
MPIYEYICLECGISFERLHLSGNNEVNCPSCSSSRIEREMSVFGFHSQGGTQKAQSSGCTGCASSSCSTCK